MTQSWIENSLKGGVTLSYSEESNGLAISGQVTSYGCGSGVQSGALIFIKGYWTKIKYTQEFRGLASCWSIFGNSLYVRLLIVKLTLRSHFYSIRERYRLGAEANPGFLLGGGAPLRNGVTDW